jgi:Cdc6-like AAA superfamily ATPase
MPDEIDDAKELIEAADKFVKEEKEKIGKRLRQDEVRPPIDYAESAPANPGYPTQYALYEEGYTATTPTIKSLPPNCYDITQDSNCVYVVPCLKPSGLLLELPEMRSDDVIRIVENFWNSEKDYKEGNEFVIGGARFSAGLLIYGPPGSGKSCTIQIVNNKLVSRKGTVFYASGHPSNVVKFLSDFAKIEKNRKSIVILEDIDSLIQQYGESYYLEMLDSAKTINNVLFIATTNYPEFLDPRVYNRPGRFSHVIKIGLPGQKAREAYLKAILKNHRDIAEIVEKTNGFTIDHLTALINAVYREKKNLPTEIERLRTLFKMPKTNEKKAIGIHSEWDNNNE